MGATLLLSRSVLLLATQPPDFNWIQTCPAILRLACQGPRVFWRPILPFAANFHCETQLHWTKLLGGYAKAGGIGPSIPPSSPMEEDLEEKRWFGQRSSSSFPLEEIHAKVMCLISSDHWIWITWIKGLFSHTDQICFAGFSTLSSMLNYHGFLKWEARLPGAIPKVQEETSDECQRQFYGRPLKKLDFVKIIFTKI